MAFNVPLELQQHIFDFLDPRSFYAARHVSRWWKTASSDPVVLAKQLRKLPIYPRIATANSLSSSAQRLYDEAARALMLGVRIELKDKDTNSLSQRISQPKVALSADGRRAASLEGRQITLYDLNSSDSPIIYQCPLNDLRAALGGGPWFKCAPTSVYELALSKNGKLLAIALERTIQIYDLEGGVDSWPIASYIPSAAGHFIAGLDFEHNDSLLRVQLSNKGTVLYLGTPKSAPADMAHWQGKGGLKHAFLDTSTIVVARSTPEQSEKLAGLQLLRPLDDGWMFVAQKQSLIHSEYCIGHVACTTVLGQFETTGTTATILTDLAITHPNVPTSSDSWRELPMAKQGHPDFSLSSDGTLIALAERETKLSTPIPSTSVFVYRIPGTKELDWILKERRNPQNEASKENDDQQNPAKEQTYTVSRLPLSLGDMRGKVLNFGFANDKVDSPGRYRIDIDTEVGARTWTLFNEY